MGDMLHKALIKKRKLQKELRKIEEFIFMYKNLESSTKYEHLEAARTNFIISESKIYEPVVKSSTIDKRKVYKKWFQGTRPEKIVSIVKGKLQLKGHPMTRSEILHELINDGVEVGGSDKAKNIGTILWRNQEIFVNLPGEGYWLRNKPCRKAGYFPEDKKSNDEFI